MSTSHAQPGASAFDRAVDYILDVDGDLYGDDERERIRWYEGIALAASVQWVVVPWVVGLLVWNASADTAKILALVGTAFILPLLLATIYVQHRKVDTRVRRWTAKRILWTAATVAPLGVFVVGYGRATNLSLEASLGMLCGGAAGIVVLMIGSYLRRRQETRWHDDDQ